MNYRALALRSLGGLLLCGALGLIAAAAAAAMQPRIAGRADVNLDRQEDIIVHIANDSLNLMRLYWRDGGCTEIAPPALDSLQWRLACVDTDLDGHRDLLFFYRGIDRHTDEETRGIVCVLSQSGLDTLERIALADVALKQSSPFMAFRCVYPLHIGTPRQGYAPGSTWFPLRPETGFDKQAAPAETPAPALLITLYPNPAGNELTVELGGLGRAPYTLEISDVHGRLLYSTALPHTANARLRLALDDYPQGSYRACLRDARGAACANRGFIVRR